MSTTSAQPSAIANTNAPAGTDAGRDPAGADAGPQAPACDPRDLAVDLADPPFESVGFKVSSLGYAVGRRFHQVLAPLELEPREFSLLRAVGAAEGHSQQAIGERLQIPPSRMVAFVDALEARGLLERRHNPHDRRTRALHLTGDGRKLLARAFVLAAALESELCAQLSGAEREQLLGLLARVGQQLGLSQGAHAAHSALLDQ
ncbi:MAG TPA: MarR family winged helix-turn-helix transcriptional regulator [Solirubrobacteraceae bacterium]|nr:MarR family winged helix-turn-helix transcriptional regulator [Solirubrobacteraceae bacterium]